MKNKLIDLSNYRFGKLIVLRWWGRDIHSKNKWMCKCSCGNYSIVQGDNLKKKIQPTQSCGCNQKQVTIKRNYRHGYAKRGLQTAEYRMWAAAKYRSKKKGIDFSIKIEDIIIPKICPLINIPIIKNANKHTPNSPSLDRKNNNFGYNKNNIEVISYKANYIKSNSSLEEFCLLLENLKNIKKAEIDYSIYKDNKKYNHFKHGQSLRSGPTDIYSIWMRTKARAKKNRLDFNLSLDDIEIPQYCPLLNIPLIVNKGRHGATNNSPSIDRINNDEGYLKGNIIIISNKANAMKSNASIDELELFLNNYKKYMQF